MERDNMERDNVNLDAIMAEFGSSSDKPYDWAKEDGYLSKQTKEEPAAENSLVATTNSGFVMDEPIVEYNERVFIERAREAERTYIYSSKDTAGVHQSSNKRHITTTGAKPKKAEWQEQADTIKQVKKAFGKKVATIGLALGLIIGATAGVYGTIQVKDYQDNEELNLARQVAVEECITDIYEKNIGPYETTTFTEDGEMYDYVKIADSISEASKVAGKVDDKVIFALFWNMGEAFTNLVLENVDTTEVDMPFKSVEEYLRAQGLVKEGKPDLEEWKRRVADTLIAQKEIDSMFPAKAENSATNTDQASRGGK